MYGVVTNVHVIRYLNRVLQEYKHGVVVSEDELTDLTSKPDILVLNGFIKQEDYAGPNKWIAEYRDVVTEEVHVCVEDNLNGIKPLLEDDRYDNIYYRPFTDSEQAEYDEQHSKANEECEAYEERRDMVDAYHRRCYGSYPKGVEYKYCSICSHILKYKSISYDEGYHVDICE